MTAPVPQIANTKLANLRDRSHERGGDARFQFFRSNSVRAQAREIVISLSVSMFCAVTVALVVVVVALWRLSQF